MPCPSIVQGCTGRCSLVLCLVFSLAVIAATAGIPAATSPSVEQYPSAGRDTLIVVDNLADLQSAIEEATQSTTILVTSGLYDLRTSPYAGSGIGIQVSRSRVTIRSQTGNRDDVIFDAGGMGDGVAKAFMISDYTTQQDSLRDITLADVTIRNASSHLISVQGEFHPRSLTFRNLHLINAGQQLIKVNPADLTDPLPVSKGTIEGCLIEYETHLDEGWYTQGIDIHCGDHWTIRENTLRNIRAHPDAGRAGGPAILVWTNSVGTIVERNRIIDCDRGIGFGDWSHDGMPYLDHSGGVIRNNFIKGYAYANPEGGLGSFEGLALANTACAVVTNNSLYSPGDIVRGIDLLGASTRSNLVANNITDKRITIRGGACRSANSFAANIEQAAAAIYLDPDNADLHLAPDSPAIDAGVPYDQICADIDSEDVADGAPDAGADEVDGTPSGGDPCDGGYAGGPIDPEDLGRLFPPPEPLPPYPLCACDPLPPPQEGTLVDTLASLVDLQNLLWELHVGGDERERTVYLTGGDYYLGSSPFGRIQIYTSNLTLRSLSGERTDVVLYGDADREYGLVMDNYGERDITGVTIADLTIRNVARSAVQVVAYYNRVDDLLLHNVHLADAGQELLQVIGSTSYGSTGTMEGMLIERDSLASGGWDANGVVLEQGSDWLIRDCVFRNLRVDPYAAYDPERGYAVRAAGASSGTRLERNIFSGCTGAILLGDAEELESHLGGVVQHNVIRGHEEAAPGGGFGSTTAIRLANCRDALLLHNSIYAPSDPPVPALLIDQAGSTGNRLQNNIADGQVAFSGGASPAENETVTNLEDAGADDFADVEGGDLHLAASSAAIDAGTLDPECGPDIDCALVWDGAPDIGADEFGASAGIVDGDPAAASPAAGFHGNHPNPFCAATTMVFTLPASARVNLTIFDLQGRACRRLLENVPLPAGTHRIVWDGEDDRGLTLPGGIYYGRIATQESSTIKKMLRLR